MHLTPYPLPRWKNEEAFIRFGLFVKGVAAGMDIKIRWGGDWKSLKDYIHFELKRRV